MRTIYETTSLWQRICVGEQGPIRFLRFGGSRAGWQGALNLRRPDQLYFPYQQAFSLYGALLQDVRRFLAVGVGTATAVKHVHDRHPGADLVAVDIDGVVIDVAKRYFAAPVDDRVQWVEADARSYVPRLNETYDLVFVDAFYREKTPAAFLSPVFLRAVAEILAPGGVLAMNVIMPTMGPARRPFDELCQTLAVLIGSVWTVDFGLVRTSGHNAVIFAQNSLAGSLTVREARANARRWMRDHPEYYAPWASVLPWLIKRADQHRS